MVFSTISCEERWDMSVCTDCVDRLLSTLHHVMATVSVSVGWLQQMQMSTQKLSVKLRNLRDWKQSELLVWKGRKWQREKKDWSRRKIFFCLITDIFWGYEYFYLVYHPFNRSLYGTSHLSISPLSGLADCYFRGYVSRSDVVHMDWERKRMTHKLLHHWKKKIWQKVCSHWQKRDHRDIVLMLWFQTPLHLAAEKGQGDVVEILVRNGANINDKTVRAISLGEIDNWGRLLFDIERERDWLTKW